MAEDLEAFAEDRSIKARRPNVIERVTRWKRNNKKIVSTAMVAASAALLLLAVSIAAWMAWKDSVTGTIKIASNEGPIVGRLVDDAGNASPTFTIPTESPLPFAAGEHILQTWSGGRIGESQRVTVAPKTNTQLRTKLSEEGVFDERTVQGVPKVLPLGDRDDLVFFHDEGVTRMDGRSGKELWTANADKFIAAIRKESFKRLTTKRKNATDQDSVKLEAPILWSIPEYRYDDDGDHNQQFLPAVAAGFPDINDDGQQDVMIACRTQAVLFAFDGKDGKILWHYNAGVLNEQSRTFHSPQSLGDIDGDNIDDFRCQFFSYAMGNNPNPSRWMDAVSGKTGERIWRRDLPTELFDVPAKMYQPSFCQMEIMRNTGCHFWGNNSPGKGWQYRRQPYKQKVNGALVPWAASQILKPNNESGGSIESGEQLLLACGSKIISCDPATGKPGRFNEGQPLELGFIPAGQPQIVQTFSTEPETLGLLLVEIVSSDPFNNNNNSNSKPITRFSMRSLDTGEELWQFDADYELEWWPGSKSNWPIIADLNGDTTPEILIADGTDLESRRPSGLASLQALDARTGKPLWDTKQRAKIRSLDRQVQYALLGPDEDGDGLDDVYVVTPMVKSRCFIFVDILSGVTGERLRTVHSEIPVFQSDTYGFAIERPFFLDTAADGPGLVIASHPMNLNHQRESTVVVSTATGELTSICDHLEHPIAGDGDGDGRDDLFLLKARDRSKPVGSSQLVSIKSGSGGIKFVGESKLTRIDDVDGDGVRDLLDSLAVQYRPGPQSLEQVQQIVSGLSGKNLSEWSYRHDPESLYPANGDFDRDGVDDFLAEEHLDVPDAETRLVMVSGATGKVLWQQPTRIVSVSDSTSHGHDIDGDGLLELLLFRQVVDENEIAQFRLSCRDGETGEEDWHFDVGQSSLIIWGFFQPSYDFRVLDVNEDGYADVLCPCFEKRSQPATVAISGKTGKPIWKLPMLSEGSGRSVEGWQTEVVSSAPSDASDLASRSVVATAWEGHDSNSKEQLNVNFFDLASGVPVASWSAEGELVDTNYGSRSQNERVLSAIADGDKRFAGIMVANGRTKELVVLDFSSDPAREVRRIDSGDLVMVNDFDDNGKTDGVFFNQKEFVTFELASGKEINRQSLAWAERIANIRTDRGSPFIRVEIRDGSNRRLKLVDPVTLKVDWDMNWPRDTNFSGLLCGDSSTKLSGKALAAGSSPHEPDASALPLAPRVLFTETNGTSSIIAAASADQFQGSDESFTEGFQSYPVNYGHDAASFTTTSDDPRLVEPLPWNHYGNPMGMFEIDGLDRNPVVLVTQLLPIVLGVIVFPVGYLFTMMRRRRWSLQWFLLLPLVFVLPYILLQMPSSLGSEYSTSMRPAWQVKLWAALMLLPFLIFIAVFTRYVFNGYWKRLALLVAFSLAIPFAMAASEVMSTPVLEGGRFDWSDPGSLWLVWAGVWAGGVGIAIVWPLAFIGKAIFRFFRRRRAENELAEPIAG